MIVRKLVVYYKDENLYKDNNFSVKKVIKELVIGFIGENVSIEVGNLGDGMEVIIDLIEQKSFDGRI